MPAPDDESIRQRPQPRRSTDREEDDSPLSRAMGRRVVAAHQGPTDDPYHTRFPPWAGPVVGVLVFGGLAAFVSFSNEGRVSPGVALAGAAAGLVIGSIVWLCDRPSGRGEGIDVGDQGTFLSRFVALLGGLLFFLPIIGLALSGWAVFLNRRRTAGWPWLVSRVAFALASLLTLAFVLMMLLARLHGP